MKTRAELDAMSHQELKDYEQILLALWTPRMAIESDIERLSTNRNELLEIFNQLKNTIYIYNASQILVNFFIAFLYKNLNLSQ